jgi:bla regulator protein blaR1
MLLFHLIGDELGPLGWSLYHFLWQGMLVAAAYSVSCLTCGRNVRRRYVLACCFFALALFLPAWQVWMILNRHHGLALGIGPPERLLPWMTWAALIWIGLATAMSIRTFFATERLSQRWLAEAFDDAILSRIAQDVASHSGLSPAPRVRRSSAADAMVVLGVACPIIIVPATMPAITNAQFRSLLAHEMAHVARRDAPVNFGLSLVESLVLFHPAAAWLAQEVRKLREYCCDDVAVRVSGDAVAYARGLTALARMPGMNPRSALSANGGDLKARVLRLVFRESLARNILVDGTRFIVWLTAAITLAAAAQALCRVM